LKTKGTGKIDELIM